MNLSSIYFDGHEDDDGIKTSSLGPLYSFINHGLQDEDSLSISNLHVPETIRPTHNHHLSVLHADGSNSNSIAAHHTVDIFPSIETQSCRVGGDHIKPISDNPITITASIDDENTLGSKVSLQHEEDMSDSYIQRQSSLIDSNNNNVYKQKNRNLDKVVTAAVTEEFMENRTFCKRSQDTDPCYSSTSVVTGPRIPDPEVIVQECNLITTVYTPNLVSNDSTTEAKSANMSVGSMSKGSMGSSLSATLTGDYTAHQHAHHQGMRLLGAIGDSKRLRFELSQRASNYLQQLSRIEQVRERFQVLTESDRISTSPHSN